MADNEKKVTGVTEEFTIQALSEEGAAIPDVTKKKDKIVAPVETDVADYTDDEIKTESQPEKKPKKKSKGRTAAKIIIAIICVILAICVGLYTAVYLYLKSLSKAVPDVEDTMVYDFDEIETVPEVLEDDEIFLETIYEGDATELKASIKEWATNGGDLMYDKDVINVLCIGLFPQQGVGIVFQRAGKNRLFALAVRAVNYSRCYIYLSAINASALEKNRRSLLGETKL